MTPAVADPETVRALQERAARAQPAEQVEIVDGWWLRHAPRSAWWIGTALPHGPVEPDDELTRRVARVEEFYTDRRTATRFQITPGACAAALDGLLATRGYRREIPVSLCATRVADVLDRLSVDRTRVEIADRPTGAWIDAWYAAQGPGTDREAQRELLDRVEGPSGYAGAVLGGELVAVGRAVADTGWIGVFGMATLPRARGRGAASAVLAALSGWAADHGIDRAYLQVECANAAALRLYELAGFTELRRFHFRTRGAESGS
jgi:GNAT superfamily N-acetyltransferase